MSATEIKSENLKIVVLFKKAGKDITALKFAEAKLKTGEVIMYDGDTPAQGQAVAINTEQGWLPAPDGVLELEDGSMIEVVDGLIANVKPAGEPTEKPAEAAPASEQPMEQNKENANPMNEAQAKEIIESITKTTKFCEDLKAEVETLKTEFSKANETKEAEFNAKLSAVENENNTLKEKVSLLIELLEKAPADKSIEQPKQTNFQMQRASEKASHQNLLDKIKSMRKGE